MNKLRNTLIKVTGFIVVVTIIGVSISCKVKDESESYMNRTRENELSAIKEEVNIGTDKDAGTDASTGSDIVVDTDENTGTDTIAGTDEVTGTDSVISFNSEENLGLLITKAIKKLSIQPIEADGNDITITLQNKNLYDGNYDNGYLIHGKEELHAPESKIYRTTKWFPVFVKQGKSLILSGTAHNRSTWQFMTEKGEILTEAGTSQNYKEVSDLLQDKTFSKVMIPEDAVAARVFYASYKGEGAASLDDRMQIEYGRIPTDYQEAQQKTVKLPLIEKNSSIYLEDEKWMITKTKSIQELDKERQEFDTELKESNAQSKEPGTETNEPGMKTTEHDVKTTEHDVKTLEHDVKTIELVTDTQESQVEAQVPDLETLELQVGDTLIISSSTACEVQVTWDDDKNKVRTGIYGVRWSLNDSNPVCERVGDAAGLHFNAWVGDSLLTPYRNDFDNIYPWSDIKLCAVKVLPDGTRSIAYSGSEGFALDGSAGNVMVEIPKFYCKREVVDDYEYLWISPTLQEGFALDPSFIGAEGEVDTIYIGAYLSSIADNKLLSASNTFPLIKKSLVQLRKLIDNSVGFTECDLLSILTVQRLYLVETAVLDSQSVFTSNVNMPYLLKDKSTSYYAVKSEDQTNRILVSKTKMTSKFRIGDAVTVISSWSVYDNTEEYQREITEVNELGNDSIEITFTGNPVDIIERETGITCIPSKNGETDLLPGITGSVLPNSGHSSFKYRGMENLWGNVSILLDRAYVKNSKLSIKYPDNRTVKIGYKLPIQNVQLSAKQFGNPTNMIVKRMGFDKENPLIMLPGEIGNEALTSSYYCDSWYNLAEKDVFYILTYGGAWDNKGYAGAFNFRATFTKTDAIPFNGSRIMLR